jgi:hypothetical protein
MAKNVQRRNRKTQQAREETSLCTEFLIPTPGVKAYFSSHYVLTISIPEKRDYHTQD